MSHILPGAGKTGTRRIFWILLVSAGLFLSRILLIRFEDALRSWSPGCLFHRFTGLHCPGCGATRAFFAMLKGDFATAWRMNPLFLAALALGIFLIGLEMLRKRGWAPADGLRLPTYSGWAIIACVAAFGILRNVPAWPFTLLAPHGRW
jgi:hypothetical protein